MTAFLHGIPPSLTSLGARFDPTEPEIAARLHLNIERIRVAEPLWQPSIAGIDKAGLGELIQLVLQNFTIEQGKQLTNCVILTGGNSLLDGFVERLEGEMRGRIESGQELKILHEREKIEGGQEVWRGMKAWSSTRECKESGTSAEEFESSGGEWMRRHRFSAR